MKIINNTSAAVKWFCYNSDDSLKLIARGSGNLDAGADHSYDPPQNMTGKYYCNFETAAKGRDRGSKLAGSEVGPSDQIELVQKYECNVRKG